MGESRNGPILITGSHRSGSTWAGKMVAASRRVGYLWEPLNPSHDPGLLQTPIDRLNFYISDHNSAQYEIPIRNVLEFRYDPLTRMRAPGGPRNIAAAMVHAVRYLDYRLGRRRPLLKDPHMLYSARWLADRFDAQVVVLIRHPAAFVHSLVKANWRYPFDDFLSQPELMADHLAPFRQEMERMVREGGDIVDEGILLWRLAHHTIANYRVSRPDWLFVRHEDLSRDPVRNFEGVFRYLKLDYDRKSRDFIAKCTGPGNPVERPGEQWPPFARLDSRRNVDRWAERLSARDVERVCKGTEDLWPMFYQDSDWKTHARCRADYSIPA